MRYKWRISVEAFVFLTQILPLPTSPFLLLPAWDTDVTHGGAAAILQQRGDKHKDKTLIHRMVEVKIRKSLLSLHSSLGLPQTSCCTGQTYLSSCFWVLLFVAKHIPMCYTMPLPSPLIFIYYKSILTAYALRYDNYNSLTCPYRLLLILWVRKPFNLCWFSRLPLIYKERILHNAAPFVSSFYATLTWSIR